jgi:hypothetical protein
MSSILILLAANLEPHDAGDRGYPAKLRRAFFRLLRAGLQRTHGPGRRLGPARSSVAADPETPRHLLAHDGTGAGDFARPVGNDDFEFL